MPGMFRVTYQIVTPESAEHGDYAEQGFALPGGWRFPIEQVTPACDHQMTLREAMSICSPYHDAGSWFNDEPQTLDYATGEEISYSIHPPRNVTYSSYQRIRRVLGVS